MKDGGINIRLTFLYILHYGTNNKPRLNLCINLVGARAIFRNFTEARNLSKAGSNRVIILIGEGKYNTLTDWPRGT